MSEPEWKKAEKQCAEILDAYYERAHRAGMPGKGDVLYMGDVIASSPDSRILLAQVKDNQKMGNHGVERHRKKAVRWVSGDHVRYEVWGRGEDNWRVYPIPIVETAPHELLKVRYATLPLDVNGAIDEYTQYRNGNVEMEGH